MASSALQTSTQRTAERFYLAPIDADEISLSSRLWEMVLALSVASDIEVLADVLDVDQAEVRSRLDTLDALGVLDIEQSQTDSEQPIAPGSLATLVAADAVDVDRAEFDRRDPVDAEEPAIAPADLVATEHDDDETRALVYRFLGSFED